MSLFFKRRKAKYDFTEDGLPSDRKEVFFDALKLRFVTFVKVGFVLLLFAIPLIAAGLIKDSYLYTIMLGAEQGEIAEASYRDYVFTIELVYLIAEAICLVAIGVGVSGALRVIRQIVWGEPIFFIEDLFDGIKMQGLRYAIYFLLIGLFNFFGRSAILLELDIGFMKYIPLGMNYVVFLPPLLFALAQSQIYKFKLTQEYKNGAILYLKTFPKTILATAIACAPLLLELIGIIVLKYVLMIVFIVFILPFLLMGEFLYFNGVLDEYINKERYPEIYDKGIRRKKTAEDKSDEKDLLAS